MQGSKDYAENPSQVSESGQEGSPSVFPHSSKLRNKLEKLAQWRIDPSLIEFPQDTREFCGGFAKVSRGLLAASFPAEEGANESEQGKGEQQSLEAGRPQSNSITQEPGEENRDKDEEADGRPAGGDQDKAKGEARKDDNEERNPHDQTSIPSAWPEHAVNAGPDLGGHNSQLQNDTQEPDADVQGKDEGTGSRIADDDTDQTKEELKRNSGDAENGLHPDSQIATPKVVAVKKFNIKADTDLERILGLALKESEILVELSHLNIVKLEGYVADLSEHKVWLIFPWEEHGNLRDFLASGEWEIPERISLINDVTLGLEYLHGREPPIYHGDLKSLNILVDSKCNALITDFGSARRLGTDEIAKRPKDKPRPAAHPTTDEEHITLEALFSATTSFLTLSGTSYTLRWAAPELLQDEQPCIQSDIWALGWIAYEVMTNTIPFHDIKKDALVINRVVQGHLPSVTEDARMSLIRALCSLMVRCWSISPEKRPTAEECRKSMSWMPMIVPAPRQTTDAEASELRHARLLNKLGLMYRKQADYPSALSSFTGALNIYTNQKDNQGRAETLRHLADVHRFRNDYREALTSYSKALQVHADLDNEFERAVAMFGLATTHALLNEYDEAFKLYSECLQIHTNTGNKRERGLNLWGLADVHRLRGEYSEAIKLYSECRQIYTDVGDMREKALTLWSLAEVYRYQAEYSDAINLYSEALQIYTDFGDRREKALTLWSLGEVHRLQVKYSEAINLYSEALQIFSDIGDRNQRARTLWDLAQVHRFRKEYSEAKKLYSEAFQIWSETGERRASGTALWGLAQVHQAQHEYNEAIKLLSEAKQTFTDVGNKYWISQTLMSLAETNNMAGHSSEAISFYTEASTVLAEMGDSRGASDTSEKAAEIRKTLAEATGDAADTVDVGNDPIPTSE